ncbi:MAG TPA: type I glyceraldehyde-3-phosphate dehydrogenase, partial [Oxalobacteraceae bacterium]|nr:type I glyceraldehyde-3-phosphate dehydrogenase [Oxalobacteraceae bacterium]
MTIRVAINGYGRIGRNILRAHYEGGKKNDIQIVAINDLGDAKSNAHLTRYDTAHGKFPGTVTVDGDSMIVNGDKIRVFAQRNPAEIPWGELNVDVVLECTGFFTTKEKASAHIAGGAKKVIISAPGGKDVDATVVYGVNQDVLKASDTVISNASCTTNSITPVMAILDEEFGVLKALMTTVHSYTADQRLVDSPHSDWRRGRAAAQNIIPTSTGAAVAAAEALPQLKGIFDGVSLRVPTLDVSLSDLTVLLATKTTAEAINDAFRAAASSDRFRGILAVAEEPLVSADFIGNSASSIVDLELTQVIDGDFVKVFAWYDNEWGYSNRLADLTLSLIHISEPTRLGKSPY